MPIYVIVAYVIFCAVPLGLGLGTHLRHRRLTRVIRELEERQSASQGDVAHG
jgi:hypothetical protein